MGHALKKQDLKVKEKVRKLKTAKRKAPVAETVPSLEELLKLYPGLSLENASLLASAYALSKKLAA